MGSLATHFFAFLFFFFIGIRRLLCSFSLFLGNPCSYRSKIWYMSEPRWKNIDLYVLLIALPIASFSEIFFFLTFSGHATYRFAFFQQAAAGILFWILIILVIIRENIDPFLMHESLVFVFAGIAFVIEYSMMGKDITGLGARVYELLGGLTLLCAVACFYLSVLPTAFFAEVVLSSSLIFKGTWVLQAGLSLYSDTFSLKGCHKIAFSPAQSTTDVQCDLEEDRLRGVALINLLFLLHLIGMLLMSFSLFGALSCNRDLRCGEGAGPSLAEIESESTLMHPLPDFELD